MQVTFLGCGDAFCSGGRFHTCFHLHGDDASILVDCGATALASLKRAALSTEAIDGVVLSHLHGDHFGGLPFLLLDAKQMQRRARPFLVLGPPETAVRLETLAETLYPGLKLDELGFRLEVTELQARARCRRDGFAVTPFLAEHSAGTPCFSLRIEFDGRIVAYSGDTAWSDALAEAALGADLFICECSSHARPLKGHLSFAELAPRLPQIQAKRIILTHMGPDMLAQRLPQIETAHDGLSLAL